MLPHFRYPVSVDDRRTERSPCAPTLAARTARSISIESAKKRLRGEVTRRLRFPPATRTTAAERDITPNFTQLAVADHGAYFSYALARNVNFATQTLPFLIASAPMREGRERQSDNELDHALWPGSPITPHLRTTATFSSAARLTACAVDLFFDA